MQEVASRKTRRFQGGRPIGASIDVVRRTVTEAVGVGPV